MSIGAGIALFVAGAILAFAVEVDPPGIEGTTLGYILMLAGLLVGVLSFALMQRSRRVVTTAPAEREVVREEPRERRVERRTERDERL
jgi:hypothetical protein